MDEARWTPSTPRPTIIAGGSTERASAAAASLGATSQGASLALLIFSNALALYLVIPSLAWFGLPSALQR